MAGSPEGGIERLLRPGFSGGADVRRQQDLLEGELKRPMAGNTIALLPGGALAREQERVRAMEPHSICCLRFPIPAFFQKLHLKGRTTLAQVQRKTSLMELASRTRTLHLNRAAGIETSIMGLTALDYKIHGTGTGSLLTF